MGYSDLPNDHAASFILFQNVRYLHTYLVLHDYLAATSTYRTRAIITRGLYIFYQLFEVHLCTVTFGLLYG